MTGPDFAGLFAWDVRRVGRSPLLWTVLGALVALLVWGATSTAALHRAQTAAQARIVTSEAAWLRDVKSRAERYSRPALPGAPELPTWQDPTDLGGFGRFFLFAHTLKPHAPLSPVAIGVSETAPSWIQVKLNTAFAGEPSYDFTNPRGAALGTIDPAFVIVYLLPIGLLLLFALLGTAERDHGMLPMIAAQPLWPPVWLAARVAAILAWSVPVVLFGLVLALTIAGAVPLAAPGVMAAGLALVLAYMLFWAGIATIALARWPSASEALSAMLGGWFVIAIGLPAIANVAIAAFAPPPSRTGYVEAQRGYADWLASRETAVVAAGLAADPALRPLHLAPDKINDLARFSIVMPKTERRLGPLHDAFRRYREAQLGLSGAVGYMFPPLGVMTALNTLAGTDDARQLRFEAATRSYQQQLRAYLYGIAWHQLAHPIRHDPAKSQGQMNFAGFDALPRYIPMRDGASPLVVLPTVGWLLLLASVAFAAGLSRARPVIRHGGHRTSTYRAAMLG